MPGLPLWWYYFQSPTDSDCPPFQYDLEGRRPIGVEQGPFTSLDYPFVRPQADCLYLLGDFYLAYDDPDRELVLPFRIEWLYGFGCLASSLPDGQTPPTHAQDLRIVDANGTVVFDSPAASFTASAWGNRLRVLQWEDDVAICRLVIHTHWPRYAVAPRPRNYLAHISLSDGELDGRTLYRFPDQLRSIKVGSTIATDAVEFHSGYNTAFVVGDTVEIEGGRRTTPIELSFTPGAGLGRFNNCEDQEVYVRRIGGVAGTADGKFTLAADGCYSLQQPTNITSLNPREATPVPATLTFGNSCGPCCECIDYDRTYLGISRLHARYKEFWLRTRATDTMLQTTVDRWTTDTQCRKDRPLKLIIRPFQGRFLDIAGAFCNRDTECLRNLQLQFAVTVTGGSSSAVVVPYTTFVTDPGKPNLKTYTLGGTYASNNLKAFWSKVEPSQNTQVRFRLEFTDPTEWMSLKVRMVATLNGDTVLQKKNGVDLSYIEATTTLEV